MNLLDDLRNLFTRAIATLCDHPEEFGRQVFATQDAKLGDYQCNAAMPLAKQVGGKPRDMAQKIIEALPERRRISTLEIAGPGFINLRLADDWIAQRTTELLNDDRLGVPRLPAPRTLVIDYSSPNVAKPMHVGHLRSTIIGDAIANLHAALGWQVIRDNHLGDWGTQFGMLIHGWRHLRDEARAKTDPLGELARLYKVVNELAEKDESIARQARQETAKLHEGDPTNVALWNQFMPWCLADLDRMYARLGIHFDSQHGESYYHPMLAQTARRLQERGIAEISDGALCVFFPDPAGKRDAEGKLIPLLSPMIVRKADGAFTYAASDIACIISRLEHERPDLIVYVVDDRQALHFRQLFTAFGRLCPDAPVRLEHVSFGKIMGKDGKPYKTREGGVISLDELISEAVSRASKIVDENSSHLPDDERRQIAEVVGIGAVKYADLSQNRSSDYIFDWDKMISMQGNTATYLQYAYARCRSIFAKAGVDPRWGARAKPALQLADPSERDLALRLLRYPEALAQSVHEFKPNFLTTYLFELANAYTRFYDRCPVIKADVPAQRESRLALCDLTARTLQTGLALLGIRTVERM